MSMTITEKIIAAHSGNDQVHPGQFVQAKVDLALGNDITAPLAVNEFDKAGFASLDDPSRVVFVLDHFTPNKDIKSAGNCKMLREFAKKQTMTKFYESGNCGVEHALLPEQGLVGPADLVIGADSHTCTYGALGAFSTGVGSTDLAAAMATGMVWLKVPLTMRFTFKGEPGKYVGGKDYILEVLRRIGVEGARYKAMEFDGPAIEALDMEGRMTICNMAIEAGGKSGIIAPDEKTREYCGSDGLSGDPDASVESTMEIDVSKLELLVAHPSLPSNVKPAAESKDVVIDQAFIGSCTNGRISDLRQAAEILKGKKAAPGVRLIIIPATPKIWRQAMDEGLYDIFMDAGAVISAPTCGPCLGGHMGVLARGEKAVSTTNRNFVGRMGHPESGVYLAGPAVTAASAVMGRIAVPSEVV